MLYVSSQNQNNLSPFIHELRLYTTASCIAETVYVKSLYWAENQSYGKAKSTAHALTCLKHSDDILDSSASYSTVHAQVGIESPRVTLPVRNVLSPVGQSHDDVAQGVEGQTQAAPSVPALAQDLLTAPQVDEVQPAPSARHCQ